MKVVRKLKTTAEWAVVDKAKKNPATKIPGLVIAKTDTRSQAREIQKGVLQ